LAQGAWKFSENFLQNVAQKAIEGYGIHLITQIKNSISNNSSTFTT